MFLRGFVAPWLRVLRDLCGSVVKSRGEELALIGLVCARIGKSARETFDEPAILLREIGDVYRRR